MSFSAFVETVGGQAFLEILELAHARFNCKMIT